MSESKNHRNKRISLRLIKRKSATTAVAPPQPLSFSWPSLAGKSISQTERYNPSAIIPARVTAQQKIRKLTPTPPSVNETAEKNTQAALPKNHDLNATAVPEKIATDHKSSSNHQLPPPRQTETAALPPPPKNESTTEKKTDPNSQTPAVPPIPDAVSLSAATSNEKARLTNPVTKDAPRNEEAVANLPAIAHNSPDPNDDLAVVKEEIEEFAPASTEKTDISHEAALVLAEQTLTSEVHRLLEEEPKLVSEIVKHWIQEDERSK